MLVIITTFVNGRADYTEQYCGRHGRACSQAYGARWPLAHEHSTTTWKADWRHTKYDVRVLTDRDGACDACAASTPSEINDVFHGRDRERGDDDAVEYADPRDEQDERRNAG